MFCSFSGARLISDNPSETRLEAARYATVHKRRRKKGGKDTWDTGPRERGNLEKEWAPNNECFKIINSGWNWSSAPNSMLPLPRSSSPPHKNKRELFVIFMHRGVYENGRGGTGEGGITTFFLETGMEEFFSVFIAFCLELLHKFVRMLYASSKGARLEILRGSLRGAIC